MAKRNHLAEVKNAQAAAAGAIAEAREGLIRAARERNLSDNAIKFVRGAFDVMTGPDVIVRKVWDNKGRARGHGKLVSVEAEEFDSGEPREVPDAMQLEALLRQAEKAYGRAAPPAALPEPPSKDALRKRKARAEGRVKPRPKRPARTPKQEVESRLRSVETRKRKLIEAQAAHDKATKAGDLREQIATYNALAKCEAGLRKAEKTVETFRRRTKGSSK